jgi:hypothetical protein
MLKMTFPEIGFENCIVLLGYRPDSRFNSPLECPDQLWFPPTSHPMATEGSFPWVRWPGHEIDHSSPCSAEVRNSWSVPSIAIRKYLLGMVLN